MRVSVIIPTRGASAPVACVASVLGQLGDTDQLLVCVDGPDPTTGLGDDHRLSVITGKKAGPGAARNRGLERADGELVLFLNDDVVAGHDLIRRHITAHEEIRDQQRAAGMVLGAAPWAVSEDDRVIDRLLRETSFIFFYDKMDGTDRWRDWGFRHAWTLNLSVLRERAGRFDPRLTQPMFDDLAWAYGTGLPVYYRPGAVVTHHHRYEPEALLLREVVLGHQTVLLREIAPLCAERSLGRPLPSAGHGDLSEASEAYDTFCGVVQERASRITSARLREVYGHARVWRDAARRIGADAALAGETVERAKAIAAERLLTRGR